MAGIDEVGRGPLAGPVLAGAVILPLDLDPYAPWLQQIDDSKVLSATRREKASQDIQKKALAVGIGMASSQEIDALGIVTATKVAMLRAVEALPQRPHHLLIDFVPLVEAGLPYTAVTDGDALCYSIAAASIVAKVARDRLMVAANGLYPGYSFHLHKGYGTPAHLEALQRLGPSDIHRFSFAPVRRLQKAHEVRRGCHQNGAA